MLKPNKLLKKNFLSSLDASTEEVNYILDLAKKFKNKDLKIDLDKKVIEELKGKRNMYNGYLTTACDKTMEELPFDVKPSGFPTISLYKGSKHIEDFKDERTRNNVLKFISKLKQRVQTRKKSKKGKKAKKAKKGSKKYDLMIGGQKRKRKITKKHNKKKIIT